MTQHTTMTDNNTKQDSNSAPSPRTIDHVSRRIDELAAKADLPELDPELEAAVEEVVSRA